MVYITRGPENTAIIHTEKPENEKYVEVESLPEEHGILKIDENGNLYVIPVSPSNSQNLSIDPLEEIITALTE